ncbi:hypothetical protein BDM02DRAFT_2427711 [Thelephora ganbajun]|uniref:Uncharacterized protein n=1 Tax=Thelephora ganbajun TaxID=370292 RepID=A0ACB6ZDZ7_THEGA|nr:hypothetical protein BDM02DRAFT_2427711 [Thelephora ganbajun]
MTPDTPNDSDVLVTRSGPISPGCPTADAILDGYSGRQQSWSPAPTISRRTSFSPIILPTQTRNPWTILHPGSFILFQLDKRELANQLLIPEGSELLEHCLAFPTKRYAGLVMGSFRGERDSDAQEHVIAFVSKSLPPGSRCSTERDSFVVPIAPTKRGNINDRQPLHPRPFPWIGCYQYTVLGARIVPTHVYPSAIEYRLSEDDFDAFDTCTIDDRVMLNFQQDSTPFISDEEALLFENMRMSDTAIALPVKVWQELTAEQDCHDPRKFVEEALKFRELALAGAGELCRP